MRKVTIDDLKDLYEELIRDNGILEEDYPFEDYLRTCGFEIKG